jgi:hypothetical protein
MSQMQKRCKICTVKLIRSREASTDLRRYCSNYTGPTTAHYYMWWQNGRLLGEFYRLGSNFTVLVSHDDSRTEFIDEDAQKTLKDIKRCLTYDEILRFERAWVMQ